MVKAVQSLSLKPISMIYAIKITILNPINNHHIDSGMFQCSLITSLGVNILNETNKANRTANTKAENPLTKTT